MVRSRPFGLFIFILVLCLLACVCAHGEVSRQEATKVVNELQEFTRKALEDLKADIKNAIDLRNKAKTYKQNAEEAARKAEKAANDNPDAEAIAETAKNASAEVLKLYSNAFDLANKYSENMKKFLPRAKDLEDRARNEIFVSEWQDGNYTKEKEAADAIKAEALALDSEVQDAMKPYSNMVDAQKEMPNFVSAAQRARYHVDVIVAVAKIDTLLKSADTDIELTEQTKDKINATEQEMKKLSNNSPGDLINYLSRLHSMVEDYLTSASREVEKAKEVKTRMVGIKAQADGDLGKVKAETDVKNAEKEADNSHWAVKNAEELVEEIKKALKSVTKSATDALHWKTSALNAINQNKKKTDAAHDSDKTNSPDSSNTHQLVKDTTEIPVESGAEQITITATDKSTDKESVIKTTEKSAESKTKQETKPIPVKPVSSKPEEDSKENDSGIERKKPIITTQDQPVSAKPKEDSKENDSGIERKKPIITTQDQPVSEKPLDETTESPEGNETEKPTMTNSEQPVSGGTDPTKPFSSDSAMTVPVPLLLAMVACAALH